MDKYSVQFTKEDFVDFTKEDLLLILYFAINKFKQDDFHQQGTSSRRDLLGGFLDRWINRAAEYLILNDVLEKQNKPYRVISDFFLYDQDTKKNAPDVLGLTDAETEEPKVIFTEYYDGEWKHKEKMPFIEVKCFKSRDFLVAVRESQMKIGKSDSESESKVDHYYVMVETHIRSDYLLLLLSELLEKNQELTKKIGMPEVFIRQDTDSRILKPILVEDDFDNNVGYFDLLGIFLEKELIKWSSRYEPKEGFLYIGDIKLHEKPIRGSKNLQNPVLLKDEHFNYKYNSVKYHPIFVKGKCNVQIVKKHKTSLYCYIEKIEKSEKLFFDEFEIKEGCYKFTFKNMERNSSWTEYFIRKDFLKKHTNTFDELPKDSLSQLIDIFDVLWSEK